MAVSFKSFLSKLLWFRKRPPTLEDAEQAHVLGRHADAAAMFRTFADAGSAAAQLRLARCYERGEGVLRNVVEAVKWYGKAADQGSVPAMARLGEIHLTGMQAPDTATPAALQQLEDGAGGESLLKRLYPKGLAVPQAPVAAAHWNSLAAEAGDSGAKARLGHQARR